MQPLERNNCTAYIRLLLEVPPLFPTTDYTGAQVWQIISCCRFCWLSCIWTASGHVCGSTSEVLGLSSYPSFSPATTRKESALLSHATHTHSYTFILQPEKARYKQKKPGMCSDQMLNQTTGVSGYLAFCAYPPTKFGCSLQSASSAMAGDLKRARGV